MSIMNSIKKQLRPLKRLIKTIIDRIDNALARAASYNRLLAGMYYLVTGTFAREHQSVLAGRRIYLDSLKDPTQNSSLLRRNIHRLEKGLLMKPRRVPFGLDYISETVAAYSLASDSGIDPSELAWARDVLDAYMDVSPSHPRIDPLRTVVSRASALICTEEDVEPRIPYLRVKARASDISIDQLLTLAEYRRSVRWFNSDPVPRSVIDRAVQVAAYSPSACNRQPFEFRIFDDPTIVSELIKLPMGTSGFGHQVPCVAIVVGKQRNYFNERDRHLIYIDGALAAMSFVYALETQGVGSCCVNWPDIELREKKMERALQLDRDERPIMLIAFGYPDEDGLVANSTKKDISALRRYNDEFSGPGKVKMKGATA